MATKREREREKDKDKERERESRTWPIGELYICSLNLWGLALERGCCFCMCVLSFVVRSLLSQLFVHTRWTFGNNIGKTSTWDPFGVVGPLNTLC